MKSKKILLFLCVMALLLTGCGTAKPQEEKVPIELIEQGKSEYVIVLSESANECERFAAQELQSFVKESAGATLPIINDRAVGYSSRSKYISIGQTRLLESAKLNLNYSVLNLDGFYIKSVGNVIFITGARDRGTLYGVYDFLERFFGVRFFNADVTKVPKTENVRLEELNIQEIPQIRFRNYYTPMVDRDALYTTRLRMVSLYGADVPEYGGTLYRDAYIYGHNILTLVDVTNEKIEQGMFFRNGGVGETIGVCYSYGLDESGNLLPGVEDSPVLEVIDTLKGMIEANPEIQYFSVTQMDIPTGCPCPTCVQRATIEKGGYTGILLRFINRVSREINRWLEEKGEDRKIKIVTFAYAWSVAPPLDETGKAVVVPDDDVVIWMALSHSYAYSLSDARQEKNLTATFEEWAKLAKEIYYWDYRVNFREYLWYMPGLTTLKADMDYLIEHHVNYAFLEGASGAATDCENWLGDLKAYVASKLMWNSDRDVPALIEEYLQGVYKDSADAVRTVIEMFEDNYERLRQDPTQTGFGIDHEFGYNTVTSKWYPRVLLTGAMRVLEKEMERVASDPEKSVQEREERKELLTAVLLTPQRMLLRNYSSYYLNDWEGERELGLKFIENCESIGYIWDIGGYGNTLESIKALYEEN